MSMEYCDRRLRSHTRENFVKSINSDIMAENNEETICNGDEIENRQESNNMVQDRSGMNQGIPSGISPTEWLEYRLKEIDAQSRAGIIKIRAWGEAEFKKNDDKYKARLKEIDDEYKARLKEIDNQSAARIKARWENLKLKLKLNSKNLKLKVKLNLKNLQLKQIAKRN